MRDEIRRCLENLIDLQIALHDARADVDQADRLHRARQDDHDREAQRLVDLIERYFVENPDPSS